ncbi:MAG: glycosyltransferase family 4 protein [Pseudomonadota bacterium]
MPDSASLRILHCFRSPVGGIFRHVRDLAEHHHRAGHKVGIICDSTTGGSHEDALFASINPYLDLGLKRTPIRRSIGPADVLTLRKCTSEIRKLQPDIIHGHGAKGGAFARLIGSQLRVSRSRVARLYSPHGGSLHYRSAPFTGRFYFALERWLSAYTDGVAFVSEFERGIYMDKIGSRAARNRLIYNGLADEEFEDVVPDNSATDFMYIGMMRDLKGPDVFVKAFIRTEEIIGRPLTATMVGDGDDKAKYEEMVLVSGRPERVAMHSAMPVRHALRLGKTVVMPSRAESMPYLVLEALAAGRPIIATNVGGIPEIFADNKCGLVPPDDVEALAQVMARSINHPEEKHLNAPNKESLKARFSAGDMASRMMDFYRECRSA